MNETLALLGGFVVACLLCLWGNVRELRRQRLLQDTPTSKALGVFIGMVELKGTAEATEALTSFLATRACVQYSWSVDESWSRTVTETYTDSNNKTQTRTRQESGWKTVAQGGESISFYLQDDTGVILVHPAGARLDTATFFSETVGRGDPLYYTKGPAGSIPDSDHRRRFVEQGLPLHEPLYVIGRARERRDLVAPEIAADAAAAIFLISVRSEEKVKSAMGRWAWLWGILGFIAACAPFIIVAVDKNHDLAARLRPIALVPPVLYVVAWGLCWVWMVYNSLVGLRQRVRQGWSLIDVQLKRRHDLIPQIVSGVTALSSHEQVVQTALAGLRAQLTATAPGTAGPDFAGVAASVRGVVERYPQLTAQPAFMALQKELVETEQRVALAKTYYNDIATEFTTRLQVLPDRWVAMLGGMRTEPLLQAADFERAPVKVALVPRNV
jgi:hypothetical protein